MRYMLTDDLWAAMEPIVLRAKGHKGGQAPVLSERGFFEALLYLARTGVPWRDLPAEFGRWDAVYNRFRRWVHSGGLRRLFEAMTSDPAFEGLRRVLIDSTIVRAHQHAAGARRKKKRSGRGAPRGSRGWGAAAVASAPRSS
jgi:putative transposase